MSERAANETSEAGSTEVESLRDGRYAVTGMLGEGSQGQTLEAVDKRDGRLVAIKRFRIKGAASWKDVELAEREARVLAQLEHSGLPRYIEHFEENGALCLVMERVEGVPLSRLAKQGLDQHAVVRLLNDMAGILDYLHLRSPPIIHRDIKPSNVIRRPDGSFALVDFGSVRDCLKPEGGSTVVGTFGYMAPEQFQGRALPVSDIYGLGATALALTTGRDPDELPHRGLAIDVQQALGRQVDPRLCHVLTQMLEPNPDARASRLASLLNQQRLWIGEGARAEQPRAAPPPRAEAWQAAEQRQWREREWHSRLRHGLHDRRHRHYQRQPGFDTWLFRSVFVLPFLLMGLRLAKVGVFALFRVMLPTLLVLLSIFFGSSLRRTAQRLDGVGRRGRRALSRAGQRLTERADGAAASRHEARRSARVRVDAPARQRVVDDGEHEPDESWLEESEPRPPAQQRRG